jgi:hypothetical protein
MSLPSYSFAHFTLRLLLICGLLFNPIAPAWSQENMAQAMAYAIARMMEAMGFPNSTVNASPLPVNPMTMTGLPSAFGALPNMTNPVAPAMAISGNTPLNQILQHFNQSWSNNGRSSTATEMSLLEGIWEDNQGGLLIVQRSHYRIYSSCNGFIDGDILVNANHVALTNRRENFTQTCEFALDQGRLVLRNHNGDVFLYRLLILDQPRQQPH